MDAKFVGTLLLGLFTQSYGKQVLQPRSLPQESPCVMVICGSDGVTYNTLCEFRTAELFNPSLKPLYLGPCYVSPYQTYQPEIHPPKISNFNYWEQYDIAQNPPFRNPTPSDGKHHYATAKLTPSSQTASKERKFKDVKAWLENEQNYLNNDAGHQTHVVIPDSIQVYPNGLQSCSSAGNCAQDSLTASAIITKHNAVPIQRSEALYDYGYWANGNEN